MRRTLLTAGVMSILLPSGAIAQEIPAIQSTATARASINTMPTDLNSRPPSDANAQVPRQMPPDIPVLKPQKPLTKKQAEGVKAASRWRVLSATPTMGQDGIVHFQYGQGEPSIVCAPLRVCDIALQEGEVVTSPPFLADHRWTAEPATSGSGNAKTTHLIVKPSDVGLITNLVVHTNRRIYSMELVSRTRDYMPLVAFDYPGDTSRSWQRYSAEMADATSSTPANPCDQPASVPPSSFKISGDHVPFLPVQAFVVSTPVGEKTCIELPADIGSRNLPALLALAGDGGWFSDPSKQMISSRFLNHRYVVDGVYDRLELVDGVGSNQQRALIERNR